MNFIKPPSTIRKNELCIILGISSKKVNPVCNEVMARRRKLPLEDVYREKELYQGEYLEVMEHFDAIFILDKLKKHLQNV